MSTGSPPIDDTTPLPLQDTWFWHMGQKVRGQAGYAIQKVPFPVDSVQAFWRSYAALPQVAACQERKNNLYLFKSSVATPMCEDAQNAGGGRWKLELAQVSDEATGADVSLDPAWLYACLHVIGCDMPDEEYALLRGVVCNYQTFGRGKSCTRLELWVGAASTDVERELVQRIGRLFAARLLASPSSARTVQADKLAFNIHSY
jgi:hypothetical protein